MQEHGTSFHVNDDYTLYIGTQGAGHVINVAGSLFLVTINDDLEETYTIRDFVTGAVLAQGAMHIEPTYENLPTFVEQTPEERERLYQRALKIIKERNVTKS